MQIVPNTNSTAQQAEAGQDTLPAVPHESYWRLFRRFLGFGLLAWGGPVAQIAMIRQELVERERWISRERFNQVLAVYQVLPGPEATEISVYFGMLARGVPGGILAGLGFVLPGFVLMFALSWFYVSFGLALSLFTALFYGFQPAVAGLIIRALQQIGRHALSDRWLWGVALVTACAELLDVHFAITLGIAGISYTLARRSWGMWAIGLGGALLLGIALATIGFSLQQPSAGLAANTSTTLNEPSLLMLFWSGLRSGLLTFGGAYTVIPYLQNDAVIAGQWMTNAQFLDGLALSGILPAPLIIFSTFVGYLGGGPLGALVLTFGIFLPAFLFTLCGHNVLERLISQPQIKTFLEGVTAGVVGLMAITAWTLLRTAVTDIPSGLICALVLLILYLWRSKFAVLVAMGIAGVLGLFFFAL